MKKLTALLLGIALVAALLAGCGGNDTADEGTAGDGTASDNMAVDPDTGANADAGDAADTATLDAIVAAVEAVNPVPNPRAYEDFDVENELMQTMDNIIAYRGETTLNGKDCATVFAAQVKDGTAEAVMEGLQSDLDNRVAVYGGYSDQFADPLLKAQDARIVNVGNFVVYVIAGVDGPDYSEIDAAISSVLGQ